MEIQDAKPARARGRTMDSERNRFEEWYVKNAFNYVRDPIGSRDCSLQWAAWQAGSESHRAELAAWRSALAKVGPYYIPATNVSDEEAEEVYAAIDAARKGEGE